MAERAWSYARQAKAPNTLRAYRADCQDFVSWCEARGLQSLPAAPETVALYLTHLAEAGRKASTMQRRLSSISQVHQAAGHESPTKSAAVRAVWAGVRRERGTAQGGKAPAVTVDIRAMVAALPEGLLGIRDRTLLLVGFAGAFRRSELVGLDVEDVAFTREGLVVTIRRSKTDQEGQGQKVGIPYGSHPSTCPVRALQAWLEASGITSGPPVPFRQPPRATPRGAPLGQGRGPGGEAGRCGRGPRSVPLCRVFTARWARHGGGPCQRPRVGHHGPDAAQERDGRPPVYSAW